MNFLQNIFQIRIKLCKIINSLSWIPKSRRRASSCYIYIILLTLTKMESHQLSKDLIGQYSPFFQENCVRKGR